MYEEERKKRETKCSLLVFSFLLSLSLWQKKAAELYFLFASAKVGGNITNKKLVAKV